MFDGLSGYKSFFFVKKLQLQFDKNNLKVSDSNIKELRKKLEKQECESLKTNAKLILDLKRSVMNRE